MPTLPTNTAIIGDLWGLILLIIIALIGTGKILSMIKTICVQLKKHDDLIDESINDVKEINLRLGRDYPTNDACARCRSACENRNNSQFAEIKTLLTSLNEKRDDLVEALGEVSCRLGRIEGALSK